MRNIKYSKQGKTVKEKNYFHFKHFFVLILIDARSSTLGGMSNTLIKYYEYGKISKATRFFILHLFDIKNVVLQRICDTCSV